LGLSAQEEDGALAPGVSSHAAETFTRPRLTTPEPADTLTPEQQTLDQRLREWRKSESERLNLPLFFVLASTTLRSIVLTRPQTLSQLKDIHGLGHEKIEKFGPGILEICTT
jgi:ATP-dependent DNA helicase RecQ